MKTMYFITGNKGKLSEVKEKLKSFDVEIIQKDLGYPEIQDDSLENVVRYGIEHLKKSFSHPFIIEDAGDEGVRFFSTENATAANRPRFSFTYTTGGGEPAASQSQVIMIN